MKRDYRLLFGPLAGIILAFGIGSLARLIPAYSHVHQTVSEIGEIGSPARVPFAIMLAGVGLCILIFAWAIRDLLAQGGGSQWAGYLIGCMAISATGVGVFAYPNPLHNLFGLSELIGYQAPLAMALTWRHDQRRQILIAISWIFYALILVAIALNLASFVSSIWIYLKPYHGLLQRALFAAWFGWCALAGLLLYWRGRDTTQMW